jgi:hypothetical protein
MKMKLGVATLRATFIAIAAALFIAGCGSSTSTPEPEEDQGPDVGTVGILFTDLPTDDFESIELDVVEAILIGGDDSQAVLFEGSEPIDLLDLENFSEPVVFGEVQAGTYTKLRLKIDNLSLTPVDGDPFDVPNLPANGKIDLLQAGGFDVLPGRTLLIEIDMDANKSIKITEAGNSGRINFRPVVKVKIVDGGDPHKLARVEGLVQSIPGDPAGSFVLCDIDSPDFCVDVATDETMTSFFDEDGLDTDISNPEFVEGAMVVVIGMYTTEPSIILNAVTVEIGGTAEQLKGRVASAPTEDGFQLLAAGGNEYTIDLQAGTQFYGPEGKIMLDAIMLLDFVEIEGVVPASADPNLMRAALVFLEDDDDDMISGMIIDPLNVGQDDDPKNFGLRNDAGDTCVNGDDDTDIILVDTVDSIVMTGTYAELELGQTIEVFGQMVEGGCFEANEIIVEVDLEATP